MLEEVERARADAQAARQEAAKAAEMAREISQRHAQAVHEDSGRAQRDHEEVAREREVRQEEVTRARTELSRAHRELRKASREVAQAHRDLSRSGRDVEITTEINLGDRAVIGVVLGKQTDKGVEIIGVSPDGPAERAGLQPGDVLVSIRGEELAGDKEARQSVFQVMRDVSDGEELAVVVNRTGQSFEYTVTAEQREPRGWQSVIRIQDIAGIPESPNAPHVVMKTIEIPEIDEVALAAEIAELSERIEATNHMFVIHDGHNVQELEIEGFSEFGRQAMDEANIWFGLPQAHGLDLASINEGLGAYFKTDRGVLVIKAREGNAYELESGDVILSIDSTEVNSPSDLVRALRDVEPGGAIAIEIKRDRKDKTLNVIVPENRLGYR
jgi:C-terminal processing protease CtpA/Prc